MKLDELKKEALKAMNNAYAPYSNCHVGAAVLLKDGKMIGGSNIENASYPLGNCAERSCLFATYSQGYRKEDIEEMVLVSDFVGDTRPCGACRQVMSELLDKDCPIHMMNIDGSYTTLTIKELLPYSFSKDDLK